MVDKDDLFSDMKALREDLSTEDKRILTPEDVQKLKEEERIFAEKRNQGPKIKERKSIKQNAVNPHAAKLSKDELFSDLRDLESDLENPEERILSVKPEPIKNAQFEVQDIVEGEDENEPIVKYNTEDKVEDTPKEDEDLFADLGALDFDS